jgi:hypothetical protein
MITSHLGYSSGLLRRILRCACPSCGAPRGEPCVSKKNWPQATPHKERVRKFKTLARERAQR